MLSGVLTVECCRRALCGEGVAPLLTPPRRIFLIIDVALAVTILSMFIAPSSTGSVGPRSHYDEPHLDVWLHDQEAASASIGNLPRPWTFNMTRGHRKKKRRKKKHGNTARRQDSHGEHVTNAGTYADFQKQPLAQLSQPQLSQPQPSHQPHQRELGREYPPTAAPDASCGSAVRQERRCPLAGGRVVVTLSIGKRSHFAVTRWPMEAYAKRVGADFAVVDSQEHAALSSWNATLLAGANSHFMKLPVLQWFLSRYQQLLFMDDDVLVSPFASDLFYAVPCDRVGAVYEGYHKQGWHTMHGRAFCALYHLEASLPSVCLPEAVKRARIFNSGVMVLSSVHQRLLDGWDRRRLECKILCDQLYMNAMVRQQNVCVSNLGDAYNLPGSEVRRLLATSATEISAAKAIPSLNGTAVADSCFLHLTVLPNKPYTSHYLLRRALLSGDVMNCTHSAGRMNTFSAVNRAAMLQQLPDFSYDIEKIWCKGRKQGCQLVPPPGATSPRAMAALSLPEKAQPPATAQSPATQARCMSHRAAARSDDPPLAEAVANASEVPVAARRVLHRAASSAWDCNTVILLFATGDFADLAINWAQAATAIGVTNFVLVAMDRKLGNVLSRFDAPPGLLLPRVAHGDVVINKLNVIGERQRFGLRTLECGFNVLFADLDALLLRNPAPILEDGDIIGERIWGRPISVVRKWGAAICTGFYFVRSSPRTIAIFRDTQERIVVKRARQPRWQASDQWAINHAIDDALVRWHTAVPMKGISDFETKFTDDSIAWGTTTRHPSKFVVLPHVHVARSCPILKHGAAPPPSEDRIEMKKWQLWQHLLRHAYVLHCFPPDSMPCAGKKHGEKGCDKSVIMGSAVHIHGEVVFDQRQGLWFMKAGWESAIQRPSTRDFFAWLLTQHNGARPGESTPG